MTVADLIHILRQHDLNAIVVLLDHSPYEGRVMQLGAGAVRPIQLGARESNGLLMLEPWVNGGGQLRGPFPGVALGSLWHKNSFRYGTRQSRAGYHEQEPR